MTEIWLTREQLQTLMMRLHHVAPERRVAMMGRLKHLQRLGWPPGSNLGKGQRVKYSAQQIVLVALALEFIQLGLTPERAVKTLGVHFNYLWRDVRYVAAAKAHMRKPALLILGPAALTDALDSLESDGEAVPDRAPNEINMLEHWVYSERRASIVNLTILLRDLNSFIGSLGFALDGELFVSLVRQSAADAARIAQK